MNFARRTIETYRNPLNTGIAYLLCKIHIDQRTITRQCKLQLIFASVLDQIKNIIATKRFATAKNQHRHKSLFLTKSPKLVDHTHRLFGRHIIRSSIITFNPPAMCTEKVALNSAFPKQQTHNSFFFSFQNQSLN